MIPLAPSTAPSPSEAPPLARPEVPQACAIVRLGPWRTPLTDQQRACVDRLIARARARQLPFLSIVDDQRRECVVWVVEPLPSVAPVATGVPA